MHIMTVEGPQCGRRAGDRDAIRSLIARRQASLCIGRPVVDERAAGSRCHPFDEGHISAITICTRCTRSGSRRTLRGLMRCPTSIICWWTAGSAAARRRRARPNFSMPSKSGGRCPLVSGKAKSGTAAAAHGVSISPHASAKKAGASPSSGSPPPPPRAAGGAAMPPERPRSCLGRTPG